MMMMMMIVVVVMMMMMIVGGDDVPLELTTTAQTALETKIKKEKSISIVVS